MLLDLVKAGTFAVLQAGIGFAVAYPLTGSPAIATGIVLIQTCVNSFAFFFHERAWTAIRRRLSA